MYVCTYELLSIEMDAMKYFKNYLLLIKYEIKIVN